MTIFEFVERAALSGHYRRRRRILSLRERQANLDLAKK